MVIKCFSYGSRNGLDTAANGLRGPVLVALMQGVKLPAVPERIETDRLVIRPPTLDDVPEILAAVHESLAELAPWMHWAKADYDLIACEENTRSAIAKFVTRQDLRYHFHDRETGRLLGCSGLHRIRWSIPRFEIGYWVRTPFAARGYVTETVRALTATAFHELGAQRVEIRCDDRNEASARVAERCGFGLDALLRNYTRATDGTLRHERIYAMLAEEFTSSSA